MKKILLLVSIFLASMILVSCEKKIDFPKIDPKDEVKLTSEEYASMVSNFDVESGKTIEVKISQEIKSEVLNMTSVINGEINKTGAKLNFIMKADYNILEATASIDFEYDIYMTNNKIYINIKKMNTKGNVGTIDIKPGKYIFDGSEIAEGIVDLDLDLDIFENLESTTLIDIESLNLLATFEGLKVYKNGETTTIKLIINEYTGLPEFTQNAIDIEELSVDNGEIYMVFEKDKLVNLSGRMNSDILGMSSYSEYIYELSNDKIIFPDFSSYKPFVS